MGRLFIIGSRLNNGSPARYDRTPSAWHNDPAISGGGCWSTEASHGIDTFLQFVGDEPVTVVGAVMSNAMFGLNIEDTAVGVLRKGEGVTGIIESGYNFPSEGGRGGDHFFRFVGSKASVFGFYGENGKSLIEVNASSGAEYIEELSHGERLRTMIDRGLTAIREGRPSETSILDAVRVLEIQDAVYDHARTNPLTNGPRPMGAPAVRP